MRRVSLTDIRGKYVVLARRHGGTWYVAAINAGKETLKLKLDLEMFAGKTVSLYKDDKKGAPTASAVESKRRNGKVTAGDSSAGRCCIGKQIDDSSTVCCGIMWQ